MQTTTDLIAAVLREARTASIGNPDLDLPTLMRVTRMFSDALTAENPKFDAWHFQVACAARPKIDS